MFVPGNNPGMMQDAYIYHPDSIMLDLEDSVTMAEKDAARLLVYNALKTIDYGTTEMVVRINPLNTPYGKKDIEAVVKAGVDVIRMPKTETAEEVIEVEPEPIRTGNQALDEMIAQGQLAMQEMRRLDDNIKDDIISGQIRKLEELSGKIFDQVKQTPEKLPQIRKFMNYYLPTTLKLLNTYDRMGAQGVSGGNIGATMERVENIMGTIVTAFEKQLDALFGAEALDISTDITVLENMMAREGLAEDAVHRTVNEEKEDKTEPSDGGIREWPDRLEA